MKARRRQAVSGASREPAVFTGVDQACLQLRQLVKGLSMRLEAIRDNPEESYLLNTEVVFRVLGVLENLAAQGERNTVALERLVGKEPAFQNEAGDPRMARRAREVLAVLERRGALTYEELRNELEPPVSYNRVTALVSEMIRDGIPLARGGVPVKVRLQGNLTASN